MWTIIFVQRKSFKFSFLQKHITGGSGNTFFNSLFVCNMFQCLLTASFTFDKERLQVKVNRILYLYFSFCVNRSSLFLVLLYFHIFQPLYPVSISFFHKMSQLSLKSQSSVHFCFGRPAWAYGILRFKDSGCFDFL